MIFITTGTQAPFDRLVKAMDAIIPNLKGESVVAQVLKSNYRAQNMETYDFLAPQDFDRYFSEAELIVSHAGMGTIISALVQKKPILIIPRLVEYGEHRNDHQLATAKAFETLDYIKVVYDLNELEEKINALLRFNQVPKHQLGKFASEELITSLQKFIIS
jgi:UDP-N-acetylglucosamine transferase subunit ALG13